MSSSDKDIICAILWWETPPTCANTGGKIRTKGGSGDNSSRSTDQTLPRDVLDLIAAIIDDPETLINFRNSWKDLVHRPLTPSNQDKYFKELSNSIPEGITIHIGYKSGFNINALAKVDKNSQQALKTFSFNSKNVQLLHIRVSGTTDHQTKIKWVEIMKNLIKLLILTKDEYQIIASISERSSTTAASPSSTSASTTDLTYINTSSCINTLDKTGSEALIVAIREADSIEAKTAYEGRLRHISFTGSSDVSPEVRQLNGGSQMVKGKLTLVRKELIDGRMRNLYRIKGRGNKFFIMKHGGLFQLNRGKTA